MRDYIAWCFLVRSKKFYIKKQVALYPIMICLMYACLSCRVVATPQREPCQRTGELGPGLERKLAQARAGREDLSQRRNRIGNGDLPFQPEKKWQHAHPFLLDRERGKQITMVRKRHGYRKGDLLSIFLCQSGLIKIQQKSQTFRRKIPGIFMSTVR